MKFLLRCLLVLAVAVVLGVLLYYAVQALPGASPTSPPPGAKLDPQNRDTPTQSIGPRPEGRKNDGRDGFRLRSIVGIAGHVALFSAIVFASVLAKNFVFERKPKNKNLPD